MVINGSRQYRFRQVVISLCIHFILLFENYRPVTAIQCFSCKGTGLNELLANTNCLEAGYLENCDDFYEYYSKVDDQKVLTENYYYDEYYDDEEEDSKNNGPSVRGKRQASKNQVEKLPVSNGNTSDLYEYYEYYVDADQVEEQVTGNIKADETEEVSKAESKEVEQEDGKDVIPSESQRKLPRDPEHHCYSKSDKLDWEQYTVEKGCRKIEYCKNDLATKHEWGNPWNFCCGKSRCNAKLVKDKPQRIFGMPCRRTDDCVQGSTTRPICPNLYKNCPKIPQAIIKMECRAKGADPTDAKQRYRNPFQEKKCYCKDGLFPKGPVCTSNGPIITAGIMCFVAALSFIVL